MDPSVPPREWTAALVLSGLRLAMTTQPTLFRFVLDHARAVLGPDSLEFAALVLRAGPARDLSLRAMCREHYGWKRTRSELYRRSNNGAKRVAAALTHDGIAVPDRI